MQGRLVSHGDVLAGRFVVAGFAKNSDEQPFDRWQTEFLRIQLQHDRSALTTNSVDVSSARQINDGLSRSGRFQILFQVVSQRPKFAIVVGAS